MHCEKALRKLAACALDEMAPPERADILDHLAACSHCRDVEARLRSAAAGVRTLPELEAAPERRARAVEAMRRGQADRLARPRWERALRVMVGRRSRLAVASLFAASLLGVTAARLLYLPPAAATVSLVAESVRGGVTVERAAAGAAEPLATGTRLPAGGVVRIAEDGRAVFRASNGGMVECRGGSAFRWEPPPAAAGDVLVTLYYGSLWCELEPLARGRYVIRDVRDRKLTVMGTKFEVVCR
jgi:hypothetical protein